MVTRNSLAGIGQIWKRLFIVACISSFSFSCKSTARADAGSGGGVGGSSGGGGGGTAGGGNQDAGPMVPIDQYCDQLAIQACAMFMRCKLAQPKEQAVCESSTKMTCKFNTLAPVTEGLIKYDPVASARCLADFATVECYDRAPPSCSQVTRMVARSLGQSCGSESNCSPDAGIFCDYRKTCSDCAPLAKLGERCQIPFSGFSHPPCASDLLCAVGNDGGMTCVPRRKEGEICYGSLDCESGLNCVNREGSPDVCFKPVVDGTVCSYPQECQSNICNRSLDAGVKRCGASPLGAPCSNHFDCGEGRYCDGHIPERSDAGILWGTCTAKDPSGHACKNQAKGGTNQYLNSDSCLNSNETCLDNVCQNVLASSRRLGQTCDDLQQCGQETHCEIADPLTHEGHCVAATPTDGGCTFDRECAYGSVCSDLNPSRSRCQPRGGAGDECLYDSDCSVFMRCSVPDGGGVNRVCVESGLPGSPCGVGNFCTGSFCNAAGNCESLKKPGEACDKQICDGARCVSFDGGTGVCTAACF